MKFRKAQIAALVLGYLRNEKLATVVEEFIKCCSHIDTNDIKVGKYFSTRVAGLSMVDYLNEYAVIHTIVQGRLEETNYFDHYTRTSLREQLLYLLDRELPNVDHLEQVLSSETDSTPAHSLPGNNSNEFDNLTCNSPKKQSKNKSQDSENLGDVTELLQQSLLENPDLQEKIAETINEVRKTPETKKAVVDEQTIDIDKIIQKTGAVPGYNRLIDEIMETTFEVFPSTSNLRASSPEAVQKPSENSAQPKDSMENHTNDAVRSIIAASQNHEVESPSKPELGNEVYLFDGTLDSYLKTTGASTNPLYLNPGLIVMPTPEPSQQFFIVNNQPVIKMQTVLTEKDIMSIPTVIVNEEKRLRPIQPKSLKKTTPTSAIPTRQNSHVRNLDFSTPNCRVNAKKKAWDEDLRQLAAGCKDKSPSPKKKRISTRLKAKQSGVKCLPPETPLKDGLLTNDSVCTPFNDVIDEQLKGVDLNEIPTPSIPITPGFALTPALGTSNHRTTDYSTSSSYYQPSDTDDKSLEQLIEESRSKAEEPEKEKSANEKVNVLSQIVVHEQVCHSQEVVEAEQTDVKKSCKEHLKRFNNNVIGKKNLSLIKRQAGSSSSSEDSDFEEDIKAGDESDENKTVICHDVKEIQSIIHAVNVKETLEEPKQQMLSQLEVIRQRTVNRLKHSEVTKKVTKRRKSRNTPKKPRKKKNEEVDEGDKLVNDLAQRGIHLMKKTPAKKAEKSKASKAKATEKTKAARKTPVKSKAKETAAKKSKPVVETIVASDRKLRKDSKKEEEEKTIEKNEALEAKGEEKSVNPKNVKEKEITKEKQDTMEEKREEIKKQEEASKQDREEEVFDGDGLDTSVFEEVEIVCESNSQKREYNRDVLSKTISMYIEGEGFKKFKWSDCNTLLELNLHCDEDELMDFVFIGDEKKGGRKRKAKSSEDAKQSEKRSKKLESKLMLLKKIDVDEFLNKVHGE